MIILIEIRKGKLDMVPDESEEHVTGNARKGSHVIRWQEAWLNCVLWVSGN